MLCYPSQMWQKCDFATSWILNPATLCGLAAMVRDIVDVKIIDAHFYNLSKEEFAVQVKAYNPDYVGISVLTSEYAKTLDISAEIVKNINSSIIVIAGGVHPTIEYESIMENLHIDYIVRGEGEEVLRDLLLYLENLGPLPNSGMVYRDGDKLVAQPQAMVADIAALPWPDYSLVELADYLKVTHRQGPQKPVSFPFYRIRVTRGCPFGCSFCQVESINGAKIRTRSPEDVVNELEFIKAKYGVTSILFDDDNITGARKFLKALLQLFIERNLNLPYQINGFAVWLLDDALLDLMQRSGCYLINIAIESGNPRVLKEIVQKPVKLGVVKQQVAKVKERGIAVLANFVIGFPGETWDEILETVHYADDLGVDYVKFFVATPLKNTKLWDMAERLNAFNVDTSNYVIDWRHSSFLSDEWTARDVDILRAYEWDRINFGTPEKREKTAKLWHESLEEMSRIRKMTRDSLFSD